MCKIAGGFEKKGSLPDLTQGLLNGRSSLKNLARQEKDGYGIAYVDLKTGELKQYKGVESAFRDSSFDDAVRAVNQDASAMAAHVRYATQGLPDLSNTHPFTHGNVSLVMNGNLPNFQQHREEILKLVNPELRPHIKGQTDTECALFVYLSILGSVARDVDHPTPEEAARALGQTMEVLSYITNKDAEVPAAMNFIIVTPELMVSSRLNRRLSMSEGFGPSRDTARLENGSAVDRLGVATLAPDLGWGWRPVPENSVVAISSDYSKLVVRDAVRRDWVGLGPEGERPAFAAVPEV